MSSDFLDAFARLPRAQQRGVRTLIFRFNDTRSSPPVAEREELTETGLGSTARCRGRRRHRQASSVRVCSPTSRRVASLRPRSAGLTALTPARRTLVQTGSCRRCSLIHPLHVVVDVPSRMTLFRATADTRPTYSPQPPASGDTKADRSDVDRFREAIAPIHESGKLGALLAQFPANFRNAAAAHGHLAWLLDAPSDWPGRGRVAAPERRHRRHAAAAERGRGRLGADRRAKVPLVSHRTSN